MAVSRRSAHHHGALSSPPRSVLLSSPTPETPSVTPDSAPLSPAEGGAAAVEVLVPAASPGSPDPAVCAQGASAAGEESLGVGGAFRELFEACRNGDVSRVKRLVDSVNVNAKDVSGRKSTPLHFAAGFGRKDVVEHLLRTGANVHARDDGGLIPLHNACSFGHAEVVSVLLCQGADPNARDNWNYTPLHEAAIKGKIDVCIGEYKKDELLEAARSGNEDKLMALLTPLNVNCHASDGRKSTPLHLAAGYNRVRIVQLLLQYGADVHAKDKGGLVPLHNACSYGHYEVTELLLKHGACVNAMDLWQFTPLHEAASKNRGEVCSLLLSHGADPTILNCHGKSAIELAHTPELRDRLAYEFKGHALLQAARDADLTKLKKVPPDIINFKHPHSQDSALKTFQLETRMQTIASLRRQKQETSTLGLVPLHNACSYGHYEVAELLVRHGASVNVADLWKFTPLHEAAAKGKYEICKLLLKHGADPSKKNRDGNVALDMVKDGDTDIQDLLRGDAALLDAAKKGCLARVQKLIVDGEYHYNFTYLDELMELLQQNNLQPGFELMGSINNTFSDFENKTQVCEWRRLVYLTAQRYIEKYGLDVVSQWNFETWNEPNNKDFDNVTMTIQGFLNYYDACLSGLRDASVSLRLGGPGDSCHTPPHSPYCWALLQHCHDGQHTHTLKNHADTQSIHYIALHKKGGGSTLPILQQLIETMQEIQRRFPLFRSLPVYNDEADPLVGWNKPLVWRADVTYAAMVIKDLLIADVNNTINFTLLSNDNAFLSYYPHQFTQRTLTARFQINNTHTPYVQFLRKPVLTAMGLLALLDVLYVMRYMDNMVSNPYEVWRLMGSPDYPSVQQLTQIRGQEVTRAHTHTLIIKLSDPDFLCVCVRVQDAQTDGPFPVPTQGDLSLRVKLPVPSILLIHLCARSTHTPGQVKGLCFVSISKGQVLMVWKDHDVGTKCVKTYEVEFSRDGVSFQRINFRDTVFTSHTFTPESLEVCGWYRVRAVDFWDRAGPYSSIERYTDFC
ncbi:Tankyrase-1 [Bagarius yarrelli]|uniref:Tankyrase-1 n=1 Tax=Bagarius yarrelli TaxID=175774 RepID=A0A556UFX1_BAGYA|nr:Tankyrase-1 [Bagarius yarrelli]